MKRVTYDQFTITQSVAFLPYYERRKRFTNLFTHATENIIDIDSLETNLNSHKGLFPCFKDQVAQKNNFNIHFYQALVQDGATYSFKTVK